MMGDGMMGAMGVLMLLWVLVGIAVLVLAVVGIIWLARRSSSTPSSTASPRETPDEVLRQRYAAGKIDDEEYARRRSGLS